MAAEDGIVATNTGYIDPAVAGQSSIAEAQEVARKAAATVHEISVLEDQATQGGMAAEPNNGLGIVADIALDVLGVGAVSKLASAGLTVVEDRISTPHASPSMHVSAPAPDIFKKLERDTLRKPGAYHDTPAQAASYGGNPKAAVFPATTTAKSAGLFERASIAGLSLKKQDSAGLYDPSPKNLSTMKSDDAASGITARVSATKQMVFALKSANELAMSSVPKALEANYAARAVAMQMAPGLAMNGPSFRPNDIVAAAKDVSEWNNPDRWRTQQT